MTTLTKADIGRAVTAIRELTDIIERLEKATWPVADRGDILRKVNDPSAAPKSDAASRALEMLAELTRKVDALKAADTAREADETRRKTYVVKQS